MTRGFSLVELIVALLILEVGVLATVGMIFLAERTLFQAERVTRGVLEAGRVADALWRIGGVGEGRAAYPGGEVIWEPDAVLSGVMRVVAVSGPERDTVASLLAWPRRAERGPSPDSAAAGSTGRSPGGEP